MTDAPELTVTMGDLVALERRIGKPLGADDAAGLISVESAAFITWRHLGDGQAFDDWLENGAGTDYKDVLAQMTQLLGFTPDEEALPVNVDPSTGGPAPSKG